MSLSSEDTYESDESEFEDKELLNHDAWAEEEEKNGPRRNGVTAMRILLFLIFTPALWYLSWYILNTFVHQAAIFQTDFEGRDDIVLMAAFFFGASFAAALTYILTLMVARCLDIRQGLDRDSYEMCPRILVMLGYMFFVMGCGITFAWSAFVSDVGLHNPITWALCFAFLWAALGIFIGACCTRMWHVLYVMFFLANFFTWPLVCRFTVQAPKAHDMWNWDYPAFPINSAVYLRDHPHGDESTSISLSPVPDSPRACNYSCDNAGGVGQADMNFPVTMRLQNQDLSSVQKNAHVLYPVLLTSADFVNWHVAADRNQAEPQPYFRSTSELDGFSFRAVIPATMSLIATTTSTPTPPTPAPPVFVPLSTRLLSSDVAKKEKEVRAGRRLNTTENTTTVPPKFVPTDSVWMRPNVGVYMVACIVTDQALLKLNQKAIEGGNNTYTTAGMLSMCSAVDGVCGFPCNQNYIAETPLPKCLANGKIDLSEAFPARAHKEIGVRIRSCLPGSASATTPPPGGINGGGPQNCQASTAPFSGWACPARGFPDIEVVARNIAHVNATQIRPTVFMFAATAANFTGAGVWERYNRYNIFDSEPSPATFYPGYPMTFVEDNAVTIRPQKCYQKAGPLYMVACAVNASNYDDISGQLVGGLPPAMGGGEHRWSGQFKLGQKVAPPPFNDRCTAVAGQCGLACQKWDRTTGAESPLVGPYCNQDGTIPQHYLVGEIELQTNWGMIVNAMVFVLILGYFQRVLSGVPGLFRPYPQYRFYVKDMTDHYRYIAVATPSASEDKICAMRNLIGTTSGYPPECKCPYHIVFLDEGHRHAYKGMFLAFIEAMYAAIRESNGNAEKIDDFMKRWVKDTRALRMEDETEKYYKDRESENWKKFAKGELEGLEEKMIEGFRKTEKKGKELIEKICGYKAWKATFKDKDPPVEFENFRREMEADKNTQKFIPEEVKPIGKNRDDIEDCDFNSRCPRELGARGVRANLKFHYLARAKIDDDDEVFQTQHVTVGMHYYTLPAYLPPEAYVGKREVKDSYWFKQRQDKRIMQAHSNPDDKDSDGFKVIASTSRGKAGGLNFATNYLYNWHLAKDDNVNDEPPDATGRADEPSYKPGLFSISDARHQYQPAFITSCMPYFFKETTPGTLERDPEVAFTQVPQFFPEMEDEKDFLDNNNAMYFRINGTIRNCCGGASSCGANGTWQIGDPRDDERSYGLAKEYYTAEHGFHEGFPEDWAEGYTWEVEPNEHIDTLEECSMPLGPRKQLKERTIFHESCKIEDTASSLNAILRGQRSQYVNMRLSYAMTKAPVSYLAAVQRWAEGAVVLMLQTYIDMPLHTKNPCLSKLANLLVLVGAPMFIIWICFYVYLVDFDPWVLLSRYEHLTGVENWIVDIQTWVFGPEGLLEDFETLNIVRQFAPAFREHTVALFLLAFSLYTWWILGIIWFIFCIYCCPTCIYGMVRRCCGSGSPVWPHEMAAWSRLAIIMDNLTYWLFFFTAFFWVFFNAYTAFSQFLVSFQTKYFYLILIVLTSCFHYAQLVCSMVRATNIQRDEGNAVLSISVDNLWRQTQLYYINAPLQLYAIVCGFQDYINQRSYGTDLSFWKGGDRGALTSQIVKCWLSTMIIIAIAAVIWQFIRPDPNMTSVIATLILCLSAMDVMFPCIYLMCNSCPGQYQKEVKEYNKRRLESAQEGEDEPLIYSGEDDSKGVPGCCAPLTKCFTCGESKDQLPVWMRFVTCSWWGNLLFNIFCLNPCVIGLLKYVGVVKEFIVPIGVGIAILAAGSESSSDGTAALLQLVAAGFTGAH